MSTVTHGDKQDLEFIRNTINMEEDKWFQKGQRDSEAGKHSSEVPESLTFANAYLWFCGWFNSTFAAINAEKAKLITHVMLTPNVSFQIVKPNEGGGEDGSQKEGSGGP